MRTIKVEELQPGQMFDKPVYMDGENLLLPANIPLRDKDIDRLKKWNIQAVQTDGKPVSEADQKAEGTAELTEALKKGPNAALLTKYVEMVKTVDVLFKNIERDSRPSTDAVNGKVDEFIGLVEMAATLDPRG